MGVLLLVEPLHAVRHAGPFGFFFLVAVAAAAYTSGILHLRESPDADGGKGSHYEYFTKYLHFT